MPDDLESQRELKTSKASLEFETIHAQVSTKIVEQFYEQRLELLGKWHLMLSILGLFYVLGFWLLGLIDTILILIAWLVFCLLNILFAMYIKRTKKPHLVQYGLISYQLLYTIQIFSKGNIYDAKTLSEEIRSTIIFIFAVVMTTTNLGALLQLKTPFSKKLVVVNTLLMYVGGV